MVYFEVYILLEVHDFAIHDFRKFAKNEYNVSIGRCRQRFLSSLFALRKREQEYTGTLMELCQGRRGVLMDMKFASKARGSIIYEIPLAEV